MVEGCDRRDDADGLALGEDLPRLALGCQIAGENLAVIENGKLAGQRIDVIGTAAFVKGVLLGKAELEGDEVREHVLAVADEFGRAEENLLALVARESGPVGGGDGKGPCRVFGAARRHRADHLVGIGIVDGHDAVGIDLLAADPHGLGDDGTGAGGSVHGHASRTWLQASAKASKLRKLGGGLTNFRLAMIGTSCSLSPP